MVLDAEEDIIRLNKSLDKVTLKLVSAEVLTASSAGDYVVIDIPFLESHEVTNAPASGITLITRSGTRYSNESGNSVMFRDIDVPETFTVRVVNPSGELATQLSKAVLTFEYQ